MASGFRTFLDGDGVTTGEVHWGAIVAGVIVALTGQVLLTLLGAGLGASFDATRGDVLSGETVAWGAYAWWAVTGIACAFAGGWTAGWVAGSYPSVDRIEGSFQGFLTWGAATLIIGILVLGLASGSVFAARIGGPLVGEATGSSVVVAGQVLTPAEQEAANDAAAAAALWSFFALIIGAAGAIGGGYLGVGHAKRMIAEGGKQPGTARKRGSTATAVS
jgi:hypothetical protein